MLVTLLNVPQSARDWEIWSFAHRESHDAINSAIRTQGGPTLADYQLDPIPPDDLRGWLERNQQAHNEMNGAVGAQSSDLLDVDLKDARQRAAWVWLHYLEHQTMEGLLKI